MLIDSREEAWVVRGVCSSFMSYMCHATGMVLLVQSLQILFSKRSALPFMVLHAATDMWANYRGALYLLQTTWHWSAQAKDLGGPSLSTTSVSPRMSFATRSFAPRYTVSNLRGTFCALSKAGHVQTPNVAGCGLHMRDHAHCI